MRNNRKIASERARSKALRRPRRIEPDDEAESIEKFLETEAPHNDKRGRYSPEYP